MPKGFKQAKKVGDFTQSRRFHDFPRCLQLKLRKDREQATVRFLSQHEEIEWARKWILPKNSQHRYGERVNCVDQLEDGTPDPGYAANLKSTFRAYPILIWRNAPTLQRDPDTKRAIKDSNGNYVIIGYSDKIAYWDINFEVYNQLQIYDNKYNGLMTRDFEIMKNGEGPKSGYTFMPLDPTPITPADQQLAATEKADISALLKIPTATELSNYLNGVDLTDPEPQTFAQQVQENDANVSPNPFV